MPSITRPTKRSVILKNVFLIVAKKIKIANDASAYLGRDERVPDKVGNRRARRENKI